jgi:type IV pilus assembly protein PilX
MNMHNTFTKQQKGAALILSLLILLVMTLIGVTAMQTTTMEERMAGNMNDQSHAMQAAEAAIYAAETELEGYVNTNDFNTTGYLRTQGNSPSDPFTTTWTDGTDGSGGNGSSGDSKETTLSGWTLGTAPKYYIEELGAISNSDSNTSINLTNNYTPSGTETNKFRITARGTGLSDDSKVYIRTHYGKQF